MPTHTEQRTLPYTAQQLFDLVADVEAYPEFLPWCLSCVITDRMDETTFLADLVVGYKMFREKFVSRVHITPTNRIRVEYLEGPMRHLSNEWQFTDHGDGTTTIDFYIDFEFRNGLLQGLMGVFFNEAFRRMVAAFETRARAVYGAPKSPKSAKKSR